MDLKLHHADRRTQAECFDHNIRLLRQEMAILDVRSKAVLPARPAPKRTLVLEADPSEGVLVAPGHLAPALQTITTVIYNWHPDISLLGTVRAEIDGDALSLAHFTEKQRNRILVLFVNRYTR